MRRASRRISSTTRHRRLSPHTQSDTPDRNQEERKRRVSLKGHRVKGENTHTSSGEDERLQDHACKLRGELDELEYAEEEDEGEEVIVTLYPPVRTTTIQIYTEDNRHQRGLGV